MRKFFRSLGVLAVFLLASFGLALAGETGPEKDLVNTLHAGERVAAQAIAKQKNGAPATKEIEELRDLLEEIQASDLLLTERQRLRSEKAGGFGGKALERQLQMEKLYRESVEELVELIQKLIQARTISPSDLERLQSLLQMIAPKKEAPILGSLPYKHLRYAATQPVTLPQVTPAYRGGNGAVSPADLQPASGSKASAAVATLAQSLNWSPVAIYEWVKNNVETEWYRGSMKGAEETLRQKSGNDADQAALLVALLRASNYPARYVQGVVEFFPEGLEKIKNLTGVSDPEKLGEVFQRAGIPYKKILSGNSIVNYQIEHIWVEAEIPYANYRGVLADAQGKVWLGLDTSIKVAGYTRTPGPIDLFAEAGNPLATLRDSYLATTQALTPLEYLQGQIQPYLNQYHSGLQYKDILDTTSLNSEALSILPASLQFKEVAITGEYSQLPDGLLHKVRFVGKNSAAQPIFDVILAAQTLSSRKIVLSFEPETVEDQEIINAWGGLDNTPSYLVRLRPVLLVEGERMAVGTEGFAMGEAFTLSLTLSSPHGTETIANSVLTGYPQVLGVVAQKPVLPTSEQLQNAAIDLLYREVLNYVDSWNRGEDELAALLKVSVIRPVPTVVTMGGVVEVVSLMGVPQGVEWKGLFIDADLRVAEPVSRVLVNDGREKAFMQLSGLQGSVLENAVFERAFAVESISTAKLFGMARDGSIPFLTIDVTNVDVVLPTLPYSNIIKTDIAAAVQQGMVVQIPLTELTAMTWTGVGYIKEKAATGEAGYMLSGRIAGGATILGLSGWPAAVFQAMTAPFTGEPNANAEEAYKITDMTPSGVKMATVGQELSSPLKVLVRDEKNVPVKGAAVAFSVRVGGGFLIDRSGAQVQALAVTTDARGVATVRFVPGQSTYSNPIAYARDGDTYGNIVGQNLVDVQLQSGSMAALPSPLAILGFAGEPASLEPVDNSKTTSIFSMISGNTGARVKDQYGNPVANALVKLESGIPSPSQGCVCPFSGSQRAQLTRNIACLNAGAAYGECSDVGYGISGPSIGNGEFVSGVILGGIPCAEYPIRASYTQSGAGSILETTTIHKSSKLGSCDNNTPPASAIYYFTEKSIAGLVGTTRNVDLRAHLVKEGSKTIKKQYSCDTETTQCNKIVGNGEFSLKFLDEVSYQNVSMKVGDTQIPKSKASSPGGYTFHYTVPTTPGSSEAQFSAQAGIMEERYEPWSCGVGCGALTTARNDIWAQDVRKIYAVAIDTPKLLVVPIDSEGYATQDVVFTYNILPVDYQARIAQVLMYRDGNLAFVSVTANSGTPSMTIPAGYWFDRNSTYSVEVLLNYSGNEDSMRSEGIPLTTLVMDLQIEGLDNIGEDMAGGFVLLNNDYDEGQVESMTGAPIPDNAGESRIVQGDDEIKKAYLVLDSQGPVISGQWVLEGPDPEKIKVYREDGRGGYVLVPLNTPQPVTLPTAIPLYLEGIAESSSIKAEQLKVIFSSATLPAVEAAVKLTVVEVDMAVDGDRNRTINFLDAADESYLFWVNNDRDERSWSLDGFVEDDKEAGDDSADQVISCLRDLEDFARLHLIVGGNIPTGVLTYQMQMVPDNGTNAPPQINLFEAVDDSEKYLGIGDVGNQPADQLLKKSLGSVGAQPLDLPEGFIRPGKVSPFLFEGRTSGQGRLRLIASYAGVPVLERNVSLALWDMSYFYDRFVVGKSGVFAAPVNTAVNPVSPIAGNSHEGLYKPASDEYVLFVHGWNVQPWEKWDWAETMFKRLWWQGFKGKVGLFDWPCETFKVAPDLLNFDTSEYQAWHSAPALKNLLVTLNQKYPGQVRLLAHSQGNATAGEAINLGAAGLVHSCVASQAAIPASLYHQIESEILPKLADFTKETPEVYGNYPAFSPQAPYWRGIAQKMGGRLYSYFNEVDYALTNGGPMTVGWEFNNKTKPDDTGWYDYIGSVDTYANPPAPGEGFVHGHSLSALEGATFVVDRELRFPSDRYEIFAFGAESRTKALGAVRPGGNFNAFAGVSSSLTTRGSRDLLNGFSFNDKHYSHSRQFRSNIVNERKYWQSFMEDMGLSTTHPPSGGN